jgi:hypothetical protein
LFERIDSEQVWELKDVMWESVTHAPDLRAEGKPFAYPENQSQFYIYHWGGFMKDNHYTRGRSSV